MKRVIICFLALVLLFTSVPFTPFASVVSVESSAADASVTVSATESKMTVKISGVGTSGKAQVVKMGADEYYNGDTSKGVSATVSSGVSIGTYTCGGTSEITFSRYTKDLEDSLYSKYYVVQSGAVLYGPVYATEISAPTQSVYQKSSTKKGLSVGGDAAYVSVLKELGCSNTTIDFDLSQLIFPNEDRSGNSVDQSNNANAICYVSNGKAYYFNKTYIESFDEKIAVFSNAGVNVNLSVTASKVSDFGKYPYSLVYTTANAGNQMAFNTSNAKGRGYFIAAMEFLADRYSRAKESGLVKNFIIGNDIDMTYANYAVQSNLTNKGKTTLDVFAEEYSRTLRLANLAVKKYCKDMTVSVPFSNNWATSAYDNSDRNSGNDYIVNTYAPKDIIDKLSALSAKRGNYDWAIAYRSSFSTADSLGASVETGAASGLKNLITGDYNTSKVISFSNLELLQQYLELEANKFSGKTRDVHIVGAGVSSGEGQKNNNANGDYDRQAAYIAYAYYKVALLDCIKSFSYSAYLDTDSSANGLVTSGKNKKPAYEVYKYVDTEESFEKADPYLSAITFKKDGAVYSKANGNISSYKDTMEIVNTSYDWNNLWNESLIKSSKAEAVTSLGLSVNKYVFSSGEDINVTATGSGDSWVGIYKADDNINADAADGKNSIYWYYVNKENGGKNHVSGRTYTLQTDGQLNDGRADLKDLPSGEYKVVLFKDSGYNAYDTVYITVTAEKSAYVKTNKTQYVYGEDIYVSAADPTKSKTWVGIYKKGDKIGSVDSVYWYYTDNSGSPVIIQTQIYGDNNSIKSTVLKEGTYEVHLFRETEQNSYEMLAKTEVTVKASNKPTAFKQMTYTLDNETDGFSNGVVTVTLPGAAGATDCVLYWADDNGPLAGYTSLAMFKLTGRTTQHRFASHTIIPPGATRLIAYSANGASSLSDTYVEVRLPEGSDYKIGDDYITEFQLVSDIHINAQGHTHNRNFKSFLEDVVANSPKSSGIFIAGDIADNGREDQFKNLQSIVASVPGAPTLHLSMGNHDWYNDNPNKQFEKYVSIFNPDANNNGKIYYDEVVDGNYYIYLGSDSRCFNDVQANLSTAQLNWLSGKLASYTERNPDKPVFILLHQSFYNTVSGSLPGEGWHGIVNEEALANVLKGYNNVIMFNGHSHWVLDSKSNMHVGTESRPTAFNTASVAYLWTGYNTVTGEHEDGSEGYYVRTYDDKVLVMGRDFVNGLYNPSAMYVVQKNIITTSKEKYVVSADSEPFNLEATALDNTSRVTFKSTNENVAIVDALGNVSVKNPGTCEIELYAGATDTKTIEKGSITIEVTANSQEIIANSFVKTYGDADFNINARYNGNPPVTYTSDNEKVATVSDNGTVSIKGTGSANITIKTLAYEGYNAAEKIITVTVVKATPVFALPEKVTKSLSEKSFSLAGVLQKGDGKLTYSSSNPAVAEVSSTGVVTLKSAGTTTLTVNAASSDNFKSYSATTLLTVATNGQVISVSDIVKTADVGTFDLGARLTEGDGTLSYKSSDESVATVSASGVVTVKKAGITNITVTASATASYAEGTKTVKLTVNKAEQSISASDVTKAAGAAPFKLSVRLEKGDGTLTYAVSDKNIAEISADGTVTVKNKGTATVTITASATDKYNAAQKTVKLTVEKGTSVITLSDMSKTADVGTIDISKCLKSGDGKLTFKSSDESVATVSSAGIITVKKAGTTTITVKAAGTNNFNSAEKSVTLKLSKAKQVIKASNASKTTISDPFTVATLEKGDGKLTFKSSDNNIATVSSKGVVTTKAEGKVKITITAAETGKFKGSKKTVTITVKKKNKYKSVIKASDVTKTYGAKKFKLKSTLTKGDGKLTYKTSNKNVATVNSKGYVTIKGVGYAYITVTAAETRKYKKATKKILIKVNPKAVKVKSLKKTSKTSAKLTWTADKKVTGYIIEYSTSKKFTSKTTKKITVQGGNKTAKTIEGLKKGKKYYVRIRSYKKGNVKVYSSYKSLSIKM